MMPLVNDHVENLDDEMQESEVFKPEFVDRILTSKDSILNEMSNVVDVKDFVYLRAKRLNKRAISK